MVRGAYETPRTGVARSAREPPDATHGGMDILSGRLTWNRYALRPMSAARNRRDVIRDVLQSERVESQEDLLGHLERRGVPSTQPVLSRDLRALGAVKREGAYVLLERERITPLETLQSLLRSAEAAGPNLVVVRCEPGAASAVARALEAENPPGVLGTVAGDDTIFVAVQVRAAGQSVLRRVRELL